jgi:hypothetical protein
MKGIKYFLYLTILFLITDCKCGFSHSGFKFSKLQKSLTINYKLSDTIYFKNQVNDFDTIYISEIDSMDRYGAILGFPRKNISVNIKHLPQNIWTDGVELSQDGKKKILDQTLIAIEKSDLQNPNDIYIGISYRDFQGEFTDTNNIIQNKLFSYAGVDNYWEIKTDSIRYEQIKNKKQKKSSLITKIIWTDKFGLTGYYKENGEFYKIQL